MRGTRDEALEAVDTTLAAHIHPTVWLLAAGCWQPTFLTPGTSELPCWRAPLGCDEHSLASSLCKTTMAGRVPKARLSVRRLRNTVPSCGVLQSKYLYYFNTN